MVVKVTDAEADLDSSRQPAHGSRRRAVVALDHDGCGPGGARQYGQDGEEPPTHRLKYHGNSSRRQRGQVATERPPPRRQRGDPRCGRLPTIIPLAAPLLPCYSTAA